MEGKEKPKRETNHPRLVVAGLISKETYLGGLSWGVARPEDFHTTCQILQVYTEASTEFSDVSSLHDLNNTLFENGFNYGNSGQSTYLKDRREGEEPLVA